MRRALTVVLLAAIFGVCAVATASAGYVTNPVPGAPDPTDALRESLPKKSLPKTNNTTKAKGSSAIRSNCTVAVAGEDNSSGPMPKLMRTRVCITPYELVRDESKPMACAACTVYDKKLAEVPLTERFPSSYYKWDSVIDGGGLFRPGQAVVGASQSGWTGFANTLFGINKWIVGANAWLTQEAFTADSTSNLTSSTAQAFKGLRSGLYSTFAALLVSFAGVWLLFQAGLGRVTRGLTGIGMMLCCLVLSIFFVSRPVQTMNAANNFSEASAQFVLKVVGQADDGVSGKGKYFPTDPTKRQIARVNDRFWKMFVYNPWVVGEFGFKASGNTDAQGRATKDVDRRVARDVNRVLTTPPNLRQDDPSSEAKKAGALNTKKLIRADKPDTDEIYPGLEGNNADGRIFSALMTLVCALMFALVQVWMAMMILLSGFVFIFLVLIGPFMLLAGLIPETGARIVRNWLFACVGVLATKAIFAGLLGIFATFFSIFQNSTHTAGGQAGMLLLATLVSVVLFSQRSRLMSLTSGTAGSAFSGAMNLPGQAHHAFRDAKQASSAMAPAGAVGGRTVRGAMMPAMAGGGAMMRSAGTGMQARALEGEDSRANRMRQRAGRIFAGDATSEGAGGLAGRLSQAGSRFGLQALKGKERGAALAGAAAGGAASGGLLAGLRGLSKKGLREQREAHETGLDAAAHEAALAARKKADEDVRVMGFESPGQVRAAKTAADMHDFRGPTSFDAALSVSEYDLEREQRAADRKAAEDAIKATAFSTPGAAKAARDALDMHDWTTGPFDPVAAVANYDTGHELGRKNQKEAMEYVEMQGHKNMTDYKAAVEQVRTAEFRENAIAAVRTSAPLPPPPKVVAGPDVESAAMESAAHRGGGQKTAYSNEQLQMIRRKENLRRRARKQGS